VDDVVAACAKIEVPPVVVLERLRPAVIAIAVGLNDDPLLAPEEVDCLWADPDVDLRRRDVVALTETQEQVLQLAPRPLSGVPGLDPQPLDLRLPSRSP
jgi:hypothetical protein